MGDKHTAKPRREKQPMLCVAGQDRHQARKRYGQEYERLHLAEGDAGYEIDREV